MNMNKKSILFKIAALTAVFTLNASLYVVLNKKATRVEASSYSVNSVPTTIDLNDTTESNIRNYYSSLNSLTANERKGTNLLKNLKPILKNGQKYFSYGGSATKAVWQAYEIVDRDWNKSPASSISGYNAQTKIITGYVYGTSNSDVGTNPYLHALYVNRDVTNQTRAWGNHEQDQWGINQEHVWAKSCGFENESPAAGARGDLMHLWAGNGRVNGNTHSNYYYGYVDQTKTYNDAGSYASTLSGNLRGTSKTLGGSVTVFEPQDSDKGDIARAIFYMAARYNYLSGSDSDGIDAGNPNLEIVNNVTSWQNSGYQSSTSTTGKMGILQDLLEWNRLDPPDQWEIHRNNLLYNNFTNNRNPFIDFPSWADAIWGVSENGSYNSTPTKSASPASDPINTFVANSFTISESSLELEVGDTAEISGSNATSNITWSVDDNTVISLNKNSTANNEAVTITALKAGSATITATSGGNNATCTVTVTQPTNYGTLENPLTVDEAIDVISITGSDATAKQMYVKGIATSNSAYNTEYSNYDYVWLQNEDGSTPQALQLFRITASDAIKNTYGTANSMNGKEIVAYGYGMYYKNTTYEIAKSNNISPVIKSVTEPVAPGPTVDSYFDNASSFANLLATESNTTQTDTNSLTFSSLGLANAADLTDYDIGVTNVAFTKETGNNGPKYYTSDLSARVYTNNKVTFTSSGSITRIDFSLVSGYDSGLSTSAGTYSSGVWTGNASSIVFNITSNTRITAISIKTSTGGLSVTDVAMRLGMLIPKTDWNTIRDEWGITSYGVMLVKETTLNGYGVSSIEAAYHAGKNLKISRKNTYSNPSSYDEDNYNITVKMTFSNESDYDIVYCVTSFIVVDDTYYFLDDMKWSINSLAAYYLTNGGSSLSSDALTLLSTTN